MSYLVLKTIHLIAIVSWFAGLFYVGRMFIYFKEAALYEEKKKQILQDQFKLMTKRLTEREREREKKQRKQNSNT